MIMNNNYENLQEIMDGADLLFEMIQELNEGIRLLPGCKLTANLKRLSSNIAAASEGVYYSMKNLALENELCDEYSEEYSEDDTEDTDNPPVDVLDAIVAFITALIEDNEPEQRKEKVIYVIDEDEVIRNKMQEASQALSDMLRKDSTDNSEEAE